MPDIHPAVRPSNKKVNKAGEILSSSNSTENEIRTAIELVNLWRGMHAYPLNTFQALLRKRVGQIDRRAVVAQRLKRTVSIHDKLLRNQDNPNGAMKLARLNDIIGLRAVMPNQSKVDKLATKYRNSTPANRFMHELIDEYDYIANPQASGYRGIHFAYKYKNKQNVFYDNFRIELQFRTLTQHQWAMAVESTGFFLQQDLKSGTGDEEWLQFFAVAGSLFAIQDGTPVCDQHAGLSVPRLKKDLKSLIENLRAIDVINSFAIVVKNITASRGSWYIIDMDVDNRSIEAVSYSKNNFDRAFAKYSELEYEFMRNRSRNIFLVSTSSVKNLRKAYPSIFSDSKEFTSRVYSLANANFSELVSRTK